MLKCVSTSPDLVLFSVRFSASFLIISLYTFCRKKIAQEQWRRKHRELISHGKNGCYFCIIKIPVRQLFIIIIHSFVWVCVHTCAWFAFHNDAGPLIINSQAPLAVSRLSHTFKSPRGASGHPEKWNVYIWTDVLLSIMYGFMQSLNKWNALWTAQTTFQIQTVAVPSKMYLGMGRWSTPASPNSW